MRHIRSFANDCVYASLAMVFDMDMAQVKRDLPMEHGVFPAPWEGLPKVPSMDEIVEWAIKKGVALVPFNFDPHCAPHAECQPVRVWEHPATMFEFQLERGKGLLEGKGLKQMHMAAWDGFRVHDPSKRVLYRWSLCNYYGFQPLRFWLAVEVK